MTSAEFRRPAVAIAAALVAISAMATAADAIECRGRYQRVAGDYIATPYCGDNYLASVARGYGTRVSDAQVRNNPSVKQQVCLHIGHDTRVSDICQPYRDLGPRF